MLLPFKREMGKATHLPHFSRAEQLAQLFQRKLYWRALTSFLNAQKFDFTSAAFFQHLKLIITNLSF